MRVLGGLGILMVILGSFCVHRFQDSAGIRLKNWNIGLATQSPKPLNLPLNPEPEN